MMGIAFFLRGQHNIGMPPANGPRNEVDALVRRAAGAVGVSVSGLARRLEIPYRTIAGWQATGRLPGAMRLLLAMLADGAWRLPDTAESPQNGRP